MSVGVNEAGKIHIDIRAFWNNQCHYGSFHVQAQKAKRQLDCRNIISTENQSAQMLLILF